MCAEFLGTRCSLVMRLFVTPIAENYCCSLSETQSPVLISSRGSIDRPRVLCCATTLPDRENLDRPRNMFSISLHRPLPGRVRSEMWTLLSIMEPLSIARKNCGGVQLYLLISDEFVTAIMTAFPKIPPSPSLLLLQRKLTMTFGFCH